jgi:hypothetical protein
MSPVFRRQFGGDNAEGMNGATKIKKIIIYTTNKGKKGMEITNQY